MTNVDIDQAKSGLDGAGLYFAPAVSVLKLTIQAGSVWYDFNAPPLKKGSMFFLADGSATAITIILDASTFTCQPVPLWDTFNTWYNTQFSAAHAEAPLRGEAFWFGSDSVGTITSTNNIYQQCYTALQGGVFHLVVGNIMTDTGSTFRQNVASFGGAIYCDACTLGLTSTTFIDHLAKDGGVIWMQDTALVTITGLTLTQAKATRHGGAFYAKGLGVGNLAFTTCAAIIEYTEAFDDGGFLYANNPNLIVSSVDCSWKHLWAVDQGGLAYGAELDSFSIS